MRQSRLAPISVGLLLVSVFVLIGFRYEEPLALSAGVAVLSLIGFILGLMADRAIRRHHMVIQGHAAALIGRWGNLGLFVLSFAFFVFDLALAIIRGDLAL